MRSAWATSSDSNGSVLRILLLASAPTLFWLWRFYRRDRDPEPKALVLKLYLLGAVVAVPAYYIEGWIPGPYGGLFDHFVRVALVEEFFKLLPVLLFVYRHKEFDEPVDGIIYMVASALGFATAENVLYAIYAGEHTLLFRAFTSTLAHVGFSGLIGYALGLAKFRGGMRLAIGAFFGSVALHGAYDLLLGSSVARGALFVMVPGMLILLSYATNHANRIRVTDRS